MIRCPSCSSEIPGGSRYCPSCGAPLETVTSAPTETSAGTEPTAAGPSSDSLDGARFIPGVILAKRYRIVGLLGRGGMGEVYRAEDLKLGRPVALKFLPAAVQQNEARLARFLNEARTALNVTHPNVCRVHDIGEVEGQHYLSMEYVDGEDLASLLRRIGRLPQDKAVEIARQICAGLAAAHEEGILHRDLKPANIMVDGRGRAKITDFGLASLAEGVEGDDAFAGTPVYMAPEQFARKPASVRSDIYSLGLVLYELFTGERVFKADSTTELARLHERSAPSLPSSLVDGFDPAVERLLMRCLEKEPDQRPVSALAVSAALPGGDPLAAALAAGETPSPEMVAGASVEGSLKPWMAIVCVVLIIAGIIGDYFLGRGQHLLEKVPEIKPPEVLTERARALLESFGYPDTPVDTAYDYFRDSEYIGHIRDTDDSFDRWERLEKGRPPAVKFWYRESPRLLVPDEMKGSVYYSDPPLTVSGMANVVLDASGRLNSLRVVPPQVDDSVSPSPEPDWGMLFKAANLDIAEFTPVPPKWVPDNFSDARAAWEGNYPGDPETTIRIEAATYRGRPVFFEIVAPWTKPDTMEESQMEPAQRIVIWIIMAIVLGVMLAAILLARHNLRQGRGDRRGAFRAALFIWLTGSAGWLLGGSHVPSLAEQSIVGTALWESAFAAALVWLIYIALEPLARRRWPATLISWSRLLAGRFRDPMIGRDILIGSLLGVAMNVIEGLEAVSQQWLGEPQSMSFYLPTESLLGGRHVISHLLQAPLWAVTTPILHLFLLLLLRIILRKMWLVVLAFYAVMLSPPLAFAEQNMLLAAAWAILYFGVILFLILRLGVLACCFAILIREMATDLQLGTWYSGGDYVTLAAVLALIAYGFWVTLAGRSLFREQLLE